MALENIGIGGVLSFESHGAVSNMGAAQRAFGSLSHAAAGARAGISKVGEGLAAFQLMGGLGVGGLVLGFEKLVHSGMEWNEYVQTTKISIGTIMAAVTKVPLAESISNADRILQHLNIVATQTHVETSEVVDTFSRLVGPMLGAGASMERLYETTKGVTILASALHQPVNRVSHAFGLLAGGTLMAREQTIQLLHSMNLLHESAAEWGALLPEQRLKRIKEILDTFEASGEYLQQTWVAQASSAKSFAKIMAGAFTKGMFDSGTSALTVFNNAFMAHSDEWLDQLTRIGQKFNAAILWAKNEVLSFYGEVRKVMNFIQHYLDYFDDDRIPGIAKGAAHILAQFMLFATALSPVISIVGFIGSKVMALVSIVEGLIGIISAIAVPLLVIGAIAAGIFLLFRNEGESIMDTLGRGWAYLKNIADTVASAVEGSMSVLKGALDTVINTGKSLWADIQPGLQDLRGIIGGVVDFIVNGITLLVPIFARIIKGVSDVISFLEPGIAVIFNFIMGLVRAVIDGYNMLMPKIMAVVGPIIDVIMGIIGVVAKLIGKILVALKPIFDAVTYIVKEIIFPLAGWLIDTFGPLFVAAWKLIGAAIDVVGGFLGVIIDFVGWLLHAVGVVLKGAWELLLYPIKAIGWVIENLIVAPVKWLIEKITWLWEKLGEIGGKIKELAGSAWDWIKSGGGLFDSIAQMQNASYGAITATNQALRSQAEIIEMNRLAAMSTQEFMMEMAKGAMKIYDAVVKPIVNEFAPIIHAITGYADVTTKQPDVKVDVNIKNNATMCVNGRNLAVAQSQYETEVAERSGFNNTPWQTQRVQIAGVKPS